MQDYEEFVEVARRILAEQINLNPADIDIDSELSTLDLDSIDIVEMVMALEDIYDVEFPEEIIDDYPTLGSMFSALYEYLQQVKNEE
ncbi:MAG: acyl carrier protein [Syntrophomonadaceae bacterium]|jgi:acyl carrier protein